MIIPVFLTMSAALAAAAAGPVPDHAQLARFSAAAFRRPNSFHWPGYMWIWNDRLDPDTLRNQLRDMAAHGAMSPMLLPEPKAFRPTSMPTRMEPDYLTSEYLERIKVVADESERLGMRFWLYDEGGWPSGNVCGQLVKQNPELGRQSLKRSVTQLADGATASVPAECLAAFLALPDNPPRRLAAGESVRVTRDGARLLVFTVARHGWHADLLNPRATDAFIAMTHERYRHAVGKHFGRAVPAIFTDEPNMGDMPWTTDLTVAFRERFGYDLLDRLPSLYEGDTSDDARTRIDYFDCWSARFASAFFGRCREWCTRNGILFAGHLNGEDETLGARKHGFGNAMRMLREMDIPGVDAIWRQLWPGKSNHHFPKFASSVAHQEGRPWAITESFAVYGSGLTPLQMKWIVDYQFVRGINLLDMIGYPLSTADWMIGGERPHCSPQNPLWDAMAAFHGYAARVSYLMALGRPRIRIALHFPIRDIWAGGPEADDVARRHDAVAHALLEQQADYDLIDDEVLERDTTQSRDGVLRVGAMTYDTVVVTRQNWMKGAARSRLEAFARSGGRILFVDPPDGARPPSGAAAVTAGDLPRLLDATVRTVTPCPALRVAVRDAGNGTVYFLTNESMEPIETVLHMPNETRRPVRLDLETGVVHAVRSQAGGAGETTIPVALPAAGSLALWFTDAPRRSVPPTEPGDVLMHLSGGWTYSKGRSHVLTETDIEIRPAADHTGGPIALGDWRATVGDAYSGEICYELTFDCTRETARAAGWLCLGDVRYACSVNLNGADLGRRLWPEWRVPVRGKLRAGRNVLRVTVANTLANQYVHNRVYERWTPAQLGPYHPTALRYEPESLQSGLFGPVMLHGGK